MSKSEQQVALVIGGSGGIGSAICKRLAADGTKIALTYRNNAQAAADVVDGIAASGGSARSWPLSLTDDVACERLLAEVAEEFGQVDSVVHAAGSAIDQPYISQVTPKQWREVIDTDVNGFFNVVHAALPHLRSSGGSLVAITSAGLYRYPTKDILSVAPKGAILALLHGVAKEEGRNGIRANAVAVGVVDAGMFPRLVERGELTQEWLDAATRNTPLRRFAQGEEIADAVAYLVSSQASYVTGQTLMLDGGYSL
jgi:NAD(P)-dependent dehydrogenase (short-subunit alcohol dehydrogenase family)